MNCTMKITVSLPEETQKALRTARPLLFATTYANGTLTIEPYTDTIAENPDTESAYCDGFSDGTASGYENGYRRGYCDAAHGRCYDAEVRDDASDEPSAEEVLLDIGCRRCAYYDTENSRCPLRD